MAGKKKAVAPPPKPVLKVLTVVELCLEDFQDLESMKELLDSTSNPEHDPTFRAKDGALGAIIYIDWVFDLRDASDLEILNEYAAEVDNLCWDFSMGDTD